jgi:ABC-type branched-subunit amino acid transport system ATPase component
MMRFGGLLAVNNVSLELRPQEIVSLIGPNGAGKTTVFNCLTGFYKPTGGTIMLRDQHRKGCRVSRSPDGRGSYLPARASVPRNDGD